MPSSATGDGERKGLSAVRRLPRWRELPSLDEFTLFFQPIVEAATGKVVAVEGLIRHVDASGGVKAPGELPFSLEEYAHDLSLIRWLVYRAQSAQAHLASAGFSLRVNLNLQGPELLHPKFVALVKTAVAQQRAWGLEPLHFELVESCALLDMQAAAQTMRECMALGVGFSLDDFGTCYSALQHMRKLPAGTVKIDRSFVSDALRSPDDLQFVQSLIAFCHASGKSVVCEGVCDSALGEALQVAQADFMQGYAISKPVSLLDLQDWCHVVSACQSWWNR